MNMPSNPDAEQQVLGHALATGSMPPEVAALDASDFYSKKHADLFTVLQMMSSRGEATDVISVNAKLNGSGGLWIRDLAAGAIAIPEATASHVALIREAADRRRTIRTAQRIIDAAASGELASVPPIVAELTPSPPDDPYGSTWDFVDLATVLEEPDTDQRPTMLRRSDSKALIYAGKTHLFAGPTESLKTWLAVSACADEIAQSNHVLYVDLEDEASAIVGRLRDLGVSIEAILEHFHYVRPDEPLTTGSRVDEGALSHLDAVLDANPYTLGIVDGFTEALALHGINMNDNTDVARFVGLLQRRLQRAGMAVVTLDHIPHDGDRAIGAQHKVSGLDGAAYLIKPVRIAGRDAENVARITVKKDRPGFVRAASGQGKQVGDVHLRTEDDGTRSVTIEPSVGSDSDPLGLSPATRRVLEALGDEPDALYPRQVQDKVIENGWAAGLRRETVSRALAELVRCGLAEELSGAYWRKAA